MAEKRYRLTAAIKAGTAYSQAGNLHKFRVGFEKDPEGPAPVVYCSQKQCPDIDCGPNDVLGTTNVYAQGCLAQSMIPQGVIVNGTPFFGTPGAAVFEETTDPVTIDLDVIFPV